MSKDKCALCGHKSHRSPCYPNCPECCRPEEDAEYMAEDRPVSDEVIERANRRVRKIAEAVSGKDGPLSQVERNRRWRQKNRERYNEYMRNYRKGKKK